MYGRRVMHYWRDATGDQRQRGMRWYREAGRAAADIAYAAGITQEQAAGVIAALSPKLPWSYNVQLASEVCIAGKRVGTYAANITKAERILQGEPVMNVLGGLKTRAFARNIAGKRDVVTVDRWMLRALGHGRDSCTPRQYERYAAIIAEAAQQVGVDARDFQAVVWVVIREEVSDEWAI
jgi:hypothetical protein